MARVVVLHDRPFTTSVADEDVLVQSAAVARALRQLGHRASIRPVDGDLLELRRFLLRIQPHFVFNLVESLEGAGRLIHVVPALVESLGIPMTGSSARAQFLTSNKVLAKSLLDSAGIATPPCHDPAIDQNGPWIIKSVWEHGSFALDDTAVVPSSDEVCRELAKRHARFGGSWYAERFMEGREFNVSMIETGDGPRVLPTSEIRFVDFPPEKPRIVGHAAKWQAGSFEYRNTVRSFPPRSVLTSSLERLAAECWAVFGLGGYARVDFRCDALGNPWVLEINANPCLSPDAGFAAALGEAGIAFATAVSWLLDHALPKRAKPARHGTRLPMHV